MALFTGYYNVTLAVSKDGESYYLTYPMVGHPQTMEPLTMGEANSEATRRARAEGYAVSGVVNTERCYCENEGG